MSRNRSRPRRPLVALLGAGGVAVFCVACTATAQGGPSTVTDVLHGSAGRAVTVAGRYAGWNGGCKGGPPDTRADWMLVDDASCIYVTGRVPAGLALPPDASSDGTPVVVHAQVERAPDGRLFLRVPRR